MLESLGLEKGANQFKAFNAWQEVTGDAIASVATPVSLERDTLLVKCKNASWRSELSFQKHDILEQLNNKLNFKIKDIRFI